jgi:FlaA1/EpsC-like NDP-sugar epimerase
MLRFLPKNNVPHWIVFWIDISLSLFALALAYLIRFDIQINSYVVAQEIPVLKISLPIYIAIKAIIFFGMKTHKGMLRYTATNDIKRVFLAVSISTLIFIVLIPIRYWYDGYYFLPISIIIVEYLASIAILLFFRFAVKLLYIRKNRKQFQSDKNVLIYGAGISGLITKRTIEQDPIIQYHIAGFVDDNPKLRKTRIEDVPIYHSDDLNAIFIKEEIDKLIIAIQNPAIENKTKVIDTCLAAGVEVLSVPSAKTWIDGSFTANEIKKVRIEDLLGREPIQLNNVAISNELKNKTILITGAAGSIGSGLVREIASFEPKLMVLLDQAESAIYDLQQELKKFNTPFEIVIADVTSQNRMRNVFQTFKPNYVFHAAAYKHVPLMESNPTEAVETNIKGTIILTDLALEFDVYKFVFISTDKAVNPTNVMGATKRISEMYVEYANHQNKTKFVTTRFGNVLGSNGSVIPLFERQIAQGGPLTVTDERVTRFFMTIPEACQLVLEAAAMGNGGEVFVFDMGQAVKIIDLAKRMIQLSGLVDGRDIEIQVTGLRPGEKLYEELLASEENTLPTHHQKILVAKLREVRDEDIEKIKELISIFNKQDNMETVRRMKELVPEFISNNSDFSILDKHENKISHSGSL